MIELLRQNLGLVMLATLVVLLTTGFPVAFTLMGTAVGFALLGNALGFFDSHWLSALALRLLGLMNDDLRRRCRSSSTSAWSCSHQRPPSCWRPWWGPSARAGGMGISSIVLGVLLAPTTGVVGATVLTIGLLTLPSMLAAGYDRRFASGLVVCAGTLGTIIPPSIILIMLSGQMRLAARDTVVPGCVSFVVNFLTIFVWGLIPPALLLARVSPMGWPSRSSRRRPRRPSLRDSDRSSPSGACL
jgi:TRAP-type mannitol/chloroaromatic compound transport system permease large subunit